MTASKVSQEARIARALHLREMSDRDADTRYMMSTDVRKAHRAMMDMIDTFADRQVSTRPQALGKLYGLGVVANWQVYKAEQMVIKGLEAYDSHLIEDMLSSALEACVRGDRMLKNGAVKVKIWGGYADCHLTGDGWVSTMICTLKTANASSVKKWDTLSARFAARLDAQGTRWTVLQQAIKNACRAEYNEHEKSGLLNVQERITKAGIATSREYKGTLPDVTSSAVILKDTIERALADCTTKQRIILEAMALGYSVHATGNTKKGIIEMRNRHIAQSAC
jgi:hypothetical protein